MLELDLVEGGPELTVMEAMGAIAAVGAVGGVILGLGAEASYGAAVLEAEQDVWRRAAGRVVAGLVVSTILLVLGALVPLPADLPITIAYARSTLRAAGAAGLITCSLVSPLIGWLTLRVARWKPQWDPYLPFWRLDNSDPGAVFSAGLKPLTSAAEPRFPIGPRASPIPALCGKPR